MALAKNTKTGLVVKVPSHYLGHPTLGKNLVAVDAIVEPAPKKEKKKAAYIPSAADADGDGIVQDGTEWERPVGTEIEEQPAPVAEPVVAEQEPIINENEEQEDGN